MASITHQQHAVSFRERVYAVMTLAQAERFWAYVPVCDHGDPCTVCCWEWQGTQARGYGSFGTTTRRAKHNWRAHRLMWMFVFGDIPEGVWVLHRCDNPPCCNPHHLFLGTPDDNQKDSMRKGRRPTGGQHGLRLHPERVLRGENNPQAKLTAAQVSAIRALQGTAFQWEIAQQFGVSKATIGLIHSGKLWKHLPVVSPVEHAGDLWARRRSERLARGEKNRRAKLTAAQVYAIRALQGHTTQQAIAHQFGVSERLVGLIHHRKVWKHLPAVAPDASAEETQV